MKKLSLSVVAAACLFISATYAQPTTSGGMSSLFSHPALIAEKKNSQMNQCPLVQVGEALTVAANLGLKPLMYFEYSNPSILSNMNKNNCDSKMTISSANGLTTVSGSDFTPYECWPKQGGLTCAIVNMSNDTIA